MNLLLDTHTLIWFLEGNRKLSTAAKHHIADPTNKGFVSIVSLWEIGIKLGLGRLEFLDPFDNLFPAELDRNGFSLVPLNITHVAYVTSLPLHHRDPFDRMLVAQCLVERFSIVSADTTLDAYGVSRLW